MKTIYADFNNRDEEHHVRLNLKKSQEGLALLGQELREGTIVWLADEEGRLEAKLHYRDGVWVGVPDWQSWQEVPFGVGATDAVVPPSGIGTPEQQEFRRLAIQLGMKKAEELARADAKVASIIGGTSEERQFRSLAMELGPKKAEELLSDTKRRLIAGKSA